MARQNKVLVVGASGLVGAAVIERFRKAGCDVIAVSRSQPRALQGAKFVSLDLTNDAACHEIFSQMSDVTHLVYAALFELPGLVGGWSDSDQINTNDRMFRNVLEPLAATGASLRHVSILQGTKAYGVHVQPLKVPAREDRDELRSQPSFYWLQEDRLRGLSENESWNWTILRPVLVVGDAIGSAMNVLAAIGVFGALLKAQGLPLSFPGGGPRVAQAVDANLLASSIFWAAEAPTARNQIFNVTNGDVFEWRHVWPAIGDTLGMDIGSPAPQSVKQYCTLHVALWDRLRQSHCLSAPSLADFLGGSLEYCDFQLRSGEPEAGPPSIVSTIKIHKAGFNEVADTEEVLRKWLTRMQQRRLLPCR